MATDIDIKRQHTLDKDKARDIVEHIAESLQDKYGVTPTWEGDTLHFSRSGVEGFLAVSDNEVHVHARLGLLLTSLRPMVEAEIRRHLNEYFPVAS